MNITTSTSKSGVTLKIEFAITELHLTLEELKEKIEKLKEELEAPFHIDNVDFYQEDKAMEDLKNILRLKKD
jgi:hypothetical protein